MVTGRQDVARGEVDLEGRHAMQRARGRPDLCGKVRQRDEVVAQHGRRVGEAGAGELHAIAGIARKTDDYPFFFLNRLDHFAARARSLAWTERHPPCDCTPY